MPVYVDDLRTIPGKGRWCHLFADTLDELHAMAEQIGLKREWFQDHPLARHYDLVPTKREAAVTAGAIELGRTAAVLKWREIRGNR